MSLGSRHGGRVLETEAGFCGLARDAIQRFGVFRFCARGQSMRPWIKDRSKITLKPVTRTLEEGDIVALCFGSRMVVHRVLYVDQETVQTAGDGNLKKDTPRPISDVVGLVVRVEWDNGWSMSFMTPAARMLGRALSGIHRWRLRAG